MRRPMQLHQRVERRTEDAPLVTIYVSSDARQLSDGLTTTCDSRATIADNATKGLLNEELLEETIVESIGV